MFNATSTDDFDFVVAEHRATPRKIHAAKIDDGATSDPTSRTTKTSNQPTLAPGDILWTRVVCDGSSVEVYVQKSATQPSSWGDWAYRSTDYDFTGGMVGLMKWTRPGVGEVDDFVLRSDRDGNGTYETLEHQESFTATPGSIGGSVEVEEALEHDAAGNLTYDGVYAYTYDAWNRLVKVTKAWRTGNVPAGSLNYGSVVQESGYDGLGRRIVKAVQNSADLDATYHYYLDGQSVVEVRNGSDLVLKQYVWGNLAPGSAYVDELVQVAINGDPLDDPNFDSSDPDHDFRGYWAMQDANYNVLGLVESDGAGGADLTERYEYTPYGQRVVFFSPGPNDPLCYSATSISRRVTWSGSGLWQPYGLLEPGHQGLHHDEELLSGEIVYNRARHLHTMLGRFMQRDPLGYVDGMGAYQYLRSSPIRWLDPRGQLTGDVILPALIPLWKGILDRVKEEYDEGPNTCNPR